MRLLKIIMKKIFILLFLLTTPVSALEEIQTYSLDPALVIRGKDGEPQPLEIQACSIEVRIRGCVAETRTTLEFYNPSYVDRREGRFLFPLPEGATVDGYALDIDNELLDGVAVEKKRAKTVFDTIPACSNGPATMCSSAASFRSNPTRAARSAFNTSNRSPAQRSGFRSVIPNRSESFR